ncbi:MAG: adenine phosphoribosyltransferase [Acidimicrobiales bacterium]|nr:adenine phosphoribosyltransferase [Acidimicrobiales bacterium]RZV48711.1 MAG: adenine phosphoribosyltransferase [Acidimicrobiales bacterium]
MDIHRLIRDVPDYPQPGIVFKDITPLLADSAALHHAVEAMSAPFAHANIDLVAGIEARGFIFGPLVARHLDVGFMPVRKPGKLPADTTSVTYDLEYGSDTLEVHSDACGPESSVLIVDDVLATGGTLAAARTLVESMEASIVGISVLVELAFLEGRAKLDGIVTHAVVEVD